MWTLRTVYVYGRCTDERMYADVRSGFWYSLILGSVNTLPIRT